MGIWKLAFALVVGAMLTEQGRKTLRGLAKEVIKNGQSVADKTSSAFKEISAEATQLVEDAKNEVKEKKQQSASANNGEK